MNTGRSINCEAQHYAASHEGICIGHSFQKLLDLVAHPDQDKRELHPYRIHYVKEYPQWNYAAMDPIEFIESSITTKSEHWKYEEEYRLLCLKGPPVKELTEEDRKFRVSPATIEKVYLGLRMDKERKAHVTNWICKHLPHVQVYRAIERRSFNLRFEKA